MRGLIAFFAIVYLSLVSGAATDQEGKTILKSYNIDKGEVINTWTPFWKDEMVYAVCEGSDADKKCKVYMESTAQDTVLSCDLNLKYSGRFDGSVILTNAGRSKVVLAVRDGETKIKLISVNLKGCHVHEASIDVSRQSLQHVDNYYASSVVIPHENNYDVFFRNKQLCGDFLCKATFNYEGKVVKASSCFPIKDQDMNFHQIEYGNNAYLVAESKRQPPNVHLVKDDDKQTKTTLFTGTWDVPSFIGLSAEERKFGLCSYNTQQKMVCKQYDVEGRTKKIEIEIPAIDNTQRMIQYLDMLNLEKGFLALTVGRKDNKSTTIAVAHFDEQGKQGKTVVIDPKCEDDHIVLAKLYRNTNGQYCVNSICMTTFDTKNRSKFSRTAKCFLNTELF